MSNTDQQSAPPTAAPTSPGWRALYVQGSFRGVGFVSAARDLSSGRRSARFELPFRDLPVTEDMGRRARELRLDCFVVGRDYRMQRDALVGALEAFGPGSLVDPWTGTASQMVVLDYQLTESTDEGGIARFTISFGEAGIITPPAPASDAAAKAVADQALTTAPMDFAKRFDVTKAAGFVEDAATALVADAALAAELAALGSGGLGGALRSFEAGLRLLPASTAALVRTPLALGQALSGLVSAVAALAPIGSSRRARALEGLGGYGAALAPVAPTTPARRQQAANQAALVNLVRTAAAAELVKSLAATRWTNREEASAVRLRIGALIDGLAATASADGDDAAARRFLAMRDAAVHDITRRSAGLSRGYAFTPRATEPALVIAQRLFGPSRVAAAAAALVAANAVRHPGFVPGGAPLQVNADG
jgi:prophage DNA circulation protein